MWIKLNVKFPVYVGVCGKLGFCWGSECDTRESFVCRVAGFHIINVKCYSQKRRNGHHATLFGSLSWWVFLPTFCCGIKLYTCDWNYACGIKLEHLTVLSDKLFKEWVNETLNVRIGTKNSDRTVEVYTKWDYKEYVQNSYDPKVKITLKK